MPGGIQGRLLREQAKAQKLKNEAMEQQMSSPLPMLQNMAALQNVLSADDRNISSLLSTAGYHSDPTEIIQNLLRQRGVQGRFRPKAVDPRIAQEQMKMQQFTNMMNMLNTNRTDPSSGSVNAEQLEALRNSPIGQQLMEIVQQQQAQ